jgi:PEP-CTERM motif
MRYFIICILFSVPALATTVLYDETTNFVDYFPSSGFPLLGLLDPGTYDVSGFLGSTFLETPSPDEDTFSVQASSGNEVVSEEINFTFRGSNTSITEPIDGTRAINSSFDTILIPVSPITGVIDVDLKGTPQVVCTGFDNTPPCTYPPSEYDITFTVQAIDSVPEPSTAGLAIGGLALCGVAFRKRKQVPNLQSNA